MPTFASGATRAASIDAAMMVPITPVYTANTSSGVMRRNSTPVRTVGTIEKSLLYPSMSSREPSGFSARAASPFAITAASASSERCFAVASAGADDTSPASRNSDNLRSS